MIYIESARTYDGEIGNSKLFEKHFFKYLKRILKEMTNIHIKTFEETAKAAACGNPLGYTQGGFLGGNLNQSDTIRDVIKSFTMAFGYTALHELQYLHSGKGLYDSIKDEGADNVFANKVLKFITQYKDKLNETTEYIFSNYSTPAESLCKTQCDQVIKRYIDEDVEMDSILKERIDHICSKGYFNNSFHMAVTEDISPIEKQDAEFTAFHMATGGRIQYVRVNSADNIEANKTLMRRAMAKGYYAGINLNADFCEDCGTRWYPTAGADHTVECPECGSSNVTEMNRICGYLGITKASGGTRVHEGKLKDIRDRKSM